MKHIQQLDGLRAFSVLGVIFYHLAVPGFGMGWLGVSFFFVLSGFLITRILLESKGRDHFFSNFYIRRSLRIFPLYYLYILVVFAYCYYLSIPDTTNWIYYILYLQNYVMAWNGFHYVPGQEMGHTWSLAVEEQFYLLWPLAICFLSKRMIMVVAIVFSIIAIASRFYLAEYTSIVSFSPLFSSMDTLLIGAILALLSSNAMVFKKVSIAFFVIGLAWFVSVVHYGALIYGWHKNIEIANQSLYMSSNLLFAGVIGCISSGVIKAKWLTFSPLLYLGKVSYGLYLWHPFAFQIIDSLQYRGHILWIDGVYISVAKFTLTLLMAAISFKFFEAPFLRLKDRFTKRSSDAPRECVNTSTHGKGVSA